ncbi:MAG: hypothetical protein ABI561_25080, partial [Bradyrhizobium sp.]
NAGVYAWAKGIQTADMAKEAIERSHRHSARLKLLLLVLIPFIPEIIIFAILQRGADSIVDFVANPGAWQAGIYLAIAGWLVVCCVAVSQGWSAVPSRLLLGFAVALVFAILPYAGPGLAIVCIKAFGGNVNEDAYTAAVQLIESKYTVIGALLAIGIFVVYAIFVIATGVASSRRPAETQ